MTQRPSENSFEPIKPQLKMILLSAFTIPPMVRSRASTMEQHMPATTGHPEHGKIGIAIPLPEIKGTNVPHLSRTGTTVTCITTRRKFENTSWRDARSLLWKIFQRGPLSYRTILPRPCAWIKVSGLPSINSSSNSRTRICTGKFVTFLWRTDICRKFWAWGVGVSVLPTMRRLQITRVRRWSRMSSA